MTIAICLALYLAVPVFSMRITGRQITWQGKVILVLLWPVAWMFMGPEELP